MANRTDFLRCPIEVCSSMTVTAPTGGVEAGELNTVGSVVGVYAEQKSAGDGVAFIYKAEKIILPKKAGTGITFAQGDKVYYDAGNGQVTDSGDEGTGDLLCGVALEAAAAADTTVLVDLDGTLEIVS